MYSQKSKYMWRNALFGEFYIILITKDSQKAVLGKYQSTEESCANFSSFTKEQVANN